MYYHEWETFMHQNRHQNVYSEWNDMNFTRIFPYAFNLLWLLYL